MTPAPCSPRTSAPCISMQTASRSTGALSWWARARLALEARRALAHHESAPVDLLAVCIEMQGADVLGEQGAGVMERHRLQIGALAGPEDPEAPIRLIEKRRLFMRQHDTLAGDRREIGVAQQSHLGAARGIRVRERPLASHDPEPGVGPDHESTALAVESCHGVALSRRVVDTDPPLGSDAARRCGKTDAQSHQQQEGERNSSHEHLLLGEYSVWFYSILGARRKTVKRGGPAGDRPAVSYRDLRCLKGRRRLRLPALRRCS